ncbi:hypothetical protein HII31_05422 [Pseudocercospora fuligena]|uniref:SMP domain-containing protein n=1 Tax=Pseudocercospora fuligena TaxID=685502 RepID=A0A8H6RLH7_9PEZI|nr:hypothetical protein HII31_05422 [Pseudocercospora fuligena]
MPQNNQMTKDDASRLQSSEAKSGNDPGFAARAQSAADRGANAASNNAGGNNNSGGKKN